MHAGLEERFAVQGAPEADGAQLAALGQRLMGEIVEQFIGSEIDVVEGDDFGRWLLHDLRAPPGFAAGVEAFADGEAEFFPKANQSGKMPSRGAIGVMVVIRPAQAQAILAGFLGLGSAVFALPVFALSGEEEIASAIDADFADGGVEQAMGPGEAGLIVSETAVAAAEGFLVAQDSRGLMIGPGRNVEAGIAVTFDND